jgi:hypothetical protein
MRRALSRKMAGDEIFLARFDDKAGITSSIRHPEVLAHRKKNRLVF